MINLGGQCGTSVGVDDPFPTEDLHHPRVKAVAVAALGNVGLIKADPVLVAE
jgi:hypothetical protein